MRYPTSWRAAAYHHAGILCRPVLSATSSAGTAERGTVDLTAGKRERTSSYERSSPFKRFDNWIRLSLQTRSVGTWQAHDRHEHAQRAVCPPQRPMRSLLTGIVLDSALTHAVSPVSPCQTAWRPQMPAESHRVTERRARHSRACACIPGGNSASLLSRGRNGLRRRFMSFTIPRDDRCRRCH